MAAVLDKQDPAAKNGSQVDEQIAQATSRIRAHDLAFGGLVLLALVLVYATAMITLDRYYVLPEWVRQVSLLGFVTVFAGTAYVALISPFRQRINPLYAARQVERTIDDAKNSVTGYVDAQQKGDLNSTVKAALASRAAKSVAEADVNRAVDHRSLVYLGAVSIAFFLTLVVLFFVFRPAQFGSLMGRAFVPFSSVVIPSQTQIKLMKPDPADPTITTGQSVTVAVHIGGKVPNAAGPDRVRLLIRHNPADPNYDELPMVAGETTRDFELRVPDYLVQNGFWYKVAAGDAVTEEYKVTVRSLPMVTETQVAYEYPKYLRRKPDSANGPLISAYRGTTVTLAARTNREVRDGLMVIEPSNTRVAGTIVPGKPDTLQFAFKLTEAGKYKLSFTATNGEGSADTFQSTIALEIDGAPQIVINKPEGDETTEVPTNGQLKVDGKIGDDFGIDTVTLKMKIVGRLERDLPDVPYMNGKSKSFRREKDDTWPTDLDYKGSVDFATLKKDSANLNVELTPDTIVEYWLEATDNCTEPKPNVGRSQSKKVRLTAPKVGEDEQKNLDTEKDERRTEEKKHTDQQQKQLAKENRAKDKPGQTDPKDRDRKNETNAGEPQNQDTLKKGDPDSGTPKKPDDQQNKGEDPSSKPLNKQSRGGNNDPNMGGTGDPAPKEGDPPSKPNTPDTAPPPSTPDQKKIEEDAKDLKNELDRQNQQGGSSKSNLAPNEADKTDPGSTKPQPMEGAQGAGPPSETKPEQKQPGQNDPANPMGQPDNAPSSDKSKGDLKKPDDPATPKPEDKKADSKPGQKRSAAPSEKQSEPLGPPPGGDKETPKEKQSEPKDPNQKQDPNSGSAGKPATQKDNEKSVGEPSGAPNPTDKKDPAADAGSRSKSMPENTRGGDKPAPQPKGAGEPQRSAPDAGDGKPNQAPPAGDTKPMPNDDPMAKGEDATQKPTDQGANAPKKPNGTDAAEVKPEGAKNPPMGGGKAVEKGIDKPAPNDTKGEQNAGSGNAPEKKLDEKQIKELQDAANNLNSSDPNKRKAAQDKLDRAIGEDKRKELEQLSKDLQSDDKSTRDAAQQKLEDIKKQMGGGKGGDTDKKNGAKPDEKQMKELQDAANNLNSPDPDKKKAAQDKLDRAIGEGKRKEMEQLAKDLQSDDKSTRDAAQQKLEDIKKQMGGGKGNTDKKDGAKLDEKQMKELQEAAKDLNSPDPNKRKAAQDKLDRAIGEDKRKEMEQLAKDLQSDDKNTRDAAQKKFENMKKELEKDAAKKDDKEPTPEEMAELMKQAQDLQSKDEKTRQKAQQELDKKIGEENRKALEEMMKNQKPSDPDQEKKTKEQLEKMAKSPSSKPDNNFAPKGPGSSPKLNGPMEEDAKNRLKSAELMLEQFENEQNRKSLQAKKGWTDAEYDVFLDGYRKLVEQRRKDAEKEALAGPKPTPSGPTDPAAPGFAPGGFSGKTEVLPGASSGPAGVGGPTAAPPGFEKARDIFQKGLQKKP